MKTLFSLFISTLFSISASAEYKVIYDLSDYSKCEYVTPAQLREANKKLIEAEGGMLTTVPLDYQDPSRGTTQIYSYFSNGFDPKRPTFVMFTGGPGQPGHLQHFPKFSFYDSLGFNFLMLDQRGIAFSRMATEEMARDARNFSSEATARDVLTILNKLKISKVSLYGASYGTVPATTFASLFPERTRALVLEGVVYNGWNGVMSGPNNTFTIQKFYDSLSSSAKDRLDQLVEQKKIPEYWLPMATRNFMMSYGTTLFPLFKEAIEEALIHRQKETMDEVSEVFSELAAKRPSSEYTETEKARVLKWVTLQHQEDPCRKINDSDDLNHLLMLKEFDASHPNVSSLLTMRGRKIAIMPGSNYAYFGNKFHNMTTTSYTASQYKVKVPTFYIQGTADGATPAPGASLHYRNSAVGPAQLLFFKGSSHMPFGLAINSINRAEENWHELRDAFVGFLNGQPLDCNAKKILETKYQHIDLAIATKGFAQTIKCH